MWVPCGNSGAPSGSDRLITEWRVDLHSTPSASLRLILVMVPRSVPAAGGGLRAPSTATLAAAQQSSGQAAADMRSAAPAPRDYLLSGAAEAGATGRDGDSGIRAYAAPPDPRAGALTGQRATLDSFTDISDTQSAEPIPRTRPTRRRAVRHKIHAPPLAALQAFDAAVAHEAKFAAIRFEAFAAAYLACETWELAAPKPLRREPLGRRFARRAHVGLACNTCEPAAPRRELLGRRFERRARAGDAPPVPEPAPGGDISISDAYFVTWLEAKATVAVQATAPIGVLHAVRATAAADEHLEHAPLQKRLPCSALGSTGGAPLQERPPSLAEPQLLDVTALLLVFDTPAPRVSDNVLALEYIVEVLVSNEYFDTARPLIPADALHDIAAGDKLLLKKPGSSRALRSATLHGYSSSLPAVDARTQPWTIFSTSFSAQPTTTSTAQHLDRAARRE